MRLLPFVLSFFSFIELLLFVIQKFMTSSLQNTGKAIIHIFTIVGYAEKKLQIVTYANILFQFAQFYIMKLMNQDQPLNQVLASFTTSLQAALISSSMVALINMFVILLIFVFTLTVVIFRSKSQQEEINSKECFNVKNIGGLITKIYIVFKIIIVPFLTINLTELNNTIQTPDMTFGGSLVILTIAIFNVLFVTLATFIYSEGLLLGRWTVLVVFLSLQFGFIDVAMKLASILILFTLSLKKSHFEKILVRLLLFIFTMDFLSFTASMTVSMMQFVIFNLMIVASQLAKEDQSFAKQGESQNEILLQGLEKQSKNKKLDKKSEIALLTIVFKNKEKIEQFSNFCSSMSSKNAKELLQNVEINTFEWLSGFFRVKIQMNLKENPHHLGFKLQKTFFQLRYQKLNAKMLNQIVKLTKQTQNAVSFQDRILMTQIEHLIQQNHFKKKQEMHSFELVNISKKVELFYKAFFQTIEIMPLFWYKYKFNSLSEEELFQILSQQIKKEQRMRRYIQELMVYKNTKTQVKLYDYAMRLLNFDYQPKMMRKGEIQFGNSQLASSHYIYLTENKISDISNRVLIELKRKREQLIGEDFEILIPYELKQFLQSRFDKALDTVKDPPELILPFIQMREFLLPYKIKIDIKFNLSVGMKYIIHFLKSQDIQQSPSFLYSLDSDLIVNSCPLFNQYLKIHKRKIDTNLLGSQLFGADLNHQINENGKGINDKIFCVLKRQKGHQQSIPIVLIIKNIYDSGAYKYALIQLQTKNIQNAAARYQTIENLIFAIDEQKNGEAKISREKIKNEEFFCKIPNPYESLLSEKMNKLSISCRRSNLKYIVIAIITFFVLFCGSIIFINQEVGIMANYYSDLISQSSEVTNEKQKIYLLTYLFYQYFQIKNFPDSLLSIQNYNITQLSSDYYNKVNNQISTLSAYPFQNLIENNGTYTLIYPNYQKQMQTTSTSIIDFMTIAKKGLVTNSANFLIRNQFALDIIVSAYKPVTMNSFNDYMTNVQNVILGFIAAFVFLALIIHILVIRTRLLARQFFNIYSKLSQHEIQSCIYKYEQLLVAGKYELYSDKKIKKNNSAIQFQSNFTLSNVHSQRLKEQKLPPQEEQEKLSINITERKINKDLKSSKQVKIKTISNGKLILKYSYVLVLPVLCFVYFLIYLTDIQTYYNNASLVLQKNLNLKNAIISMVKKTEKFYQASMIEQITLKPPNGWINPVSENVEINIDINLPPQFDNYLQNQRMILNYDLCANLIPNNDSLYSNINCYDILNGVMSKGLLQTFILFTNLVQNYGGTLMSQFVNVYRSNARYPVYMQIIYVHQAVTSILNHLQSQYNTTTFRYINTQNQKIIGDLIKGLVVVPLLSLLIVYIVYTGHNQSKAIIKAFRVLPKTFLLNIRTTKFLKNEEILDKMQMIPL